MRKVTVKGAVVTVHGDLATQVRRAAKEAGVRPQRLISRIIRQDMEHPEVLNDYVRRQGLR